MAKREPLFKYFGNKPRSSIHYPPLKHNIIIEPLFYLNGYDTHTLPPNPMANVKHILHKIPSTPSSNIITFAPPHPFKCTHVLLWFPGPLTINEITIGNTEQLTVHIPGKLLASPVTLEIIEKWFEAEILSEMLAEHHVCSLTLDTVKKNERITLQYKGYLELMALYGVELQ